MSDLTTTAPARIWLNVFEDETEQFPEDHAGITWCEDKIGEHDVEYTRADVADIRIAELEAALAEAQRERDRALEDAGAARLAFEDWRVTHSTVQLEAENELLKQRLAEAQKDVKRIDWIIKHAGYGIDERACTVLRLPLLIPAPDHLGCLKGAIDAAMQEAER